MARSLWFGKHDHCEAEWEETGWVKSCSRRTFMWGLKNKLLCGFYLRSWHGQQSISSVVAIHFPQICLWGKGGCFYLEFCCSGVFSALWLVAVMKGLLLVLSQGPVELKGTPSFCCGRAGTGATISPDHIVLSLLRQKGLSICFLGWVLRYLYIYIYNLLMFAPHLTAVFWAQVAKLSFFCKAETSKRRNRAHRIE